MKNKLLVLALFIYQSTSAQTFMIGSIDLYGNRKTDSALIRNNLDLKKGDSINFKNFKREAISTKLKQIPGVKYAEINPICCDNHNNVMFYIGIGETDSVILKHRDTPIRHIKLPAEMIRAYRNYSDQILPAIQNGQGNEDDSKGYALLQYPPARKENDRFIVFASQKLPLLLNVLRKSKLAEQRAAAATIIAYSRDRKKVVDNLLYAVDDADEEVRNDATRALGILAGYIGSHPKLKITIPAAPFIKMMNSIVWTDRNKGASVLMQLTQRRDKALLNQLKQQALLSIIEMAKWEDWGHAIFSFVILGRIAGIDDNILFGEQSSTNHLTQIEAMVQKCYQ